MFTEETRDTMNNINLDENIVDERKYKSIIIYISHSSFSVIEITQFFEPK